METIWHILTREFLGYPLYGWLILVCMIVLFVWLGLTTATDNCSISADGLNCGD